MEGICGSNMAWSFVVWSSSLFQQTSMSSRDNNSSSSSGSIMGRWVFMSGVLGLFYVRDDMILWLLGGRSCRHMNEIPH